MNLRRTVATLAAVALPLAGLAALVPTPAVHAATTSLSLVGQWDTPHMNKTFFVLTLTVLATRASAGTLVTPPLIFQPGGQMNCLVANAASEPVDVVSWGLFAADGTEASVGGRIAPFTLQPGSAESIDTLAAPFGGTYICKVVVNGCKSRVRVSIVSRDGTATTTAALAGQ